jgi:hypothetical protein
MSKETHTEKEQKHYEMLVYVQSLYDVIENIDGFKHTLKYITKNYKQQLEQFLNETYAADLDFKFISNLLETYNNFNNMPLEWKMNIILIYKAIQEQKITIEEDITVLRTSEYKHLCPTDHGKFFHLLKMGITLTFPSGFIFEPIEADGNKFIQTLFKKDNMRFKQGIWQLNETGLTYAMEEKLEYETNGHRMD